MNVRFDRGNPEVCSFTGYRPSKLPFLRDSGGSEYRRLYSALRLEVMSLAKKGVKYFQTGMARGIDLMCGEIVLELKRDYDIKLICVIPCVNQTSGWARKDIEKYGFLMSNSDGVINVTGEPYRDGCMLLRNRRLVDTAQYIIAVFDGQKGGTMSTVNYAKKKGRTIILIDPVSFNRIELIHGNNEGVLYV